MADRRDPEFERWLKDHVSVEEIIAQCTDDVYAAFYRGWKEAMTEKADSLTERKPDGTAIIPE